MHEQKMLAQRPAVRRSSRTLGVKIKSPRLDLRGLAAGALKPYLVERFLQLYHEEQVPVPSTVVDLHDEPAQSHMPQP